MDNPFLNRGSLAGLIAKRNQVNSTMEGASPFNAFMARKKARQVDEAINQFGNAAIRRPMPQPMAPQPVAPRPMAPRPMPAAQPMRPQPMPAAAPVALPTAFGNVGPSSGGTSSTVTVSGGGLPPMPMPQAAPMPQQMPQMPAQGGGWNALGLGGFGGFDPRLLMQQRGFGYGGYGQGFHGFGGAQPYRPTPAGGFAGLF